MRGESAAFSLASDDQESGVEVAITLGARSTTFLEPTVGAGAAALGAASVEREVICCAAPTPNAPTQSPTAVALPKVPQSTNDPLTLDAAAAEAT